MADKSKRKKLIEINLDEGGFSAIFKRFRGEKKQFSEISLIRSILTPEKARILHMIKLKQPLMHMQ